jgi:hypothetical protein
MTLNGEDAVRVQDTVEVEGSLDYTFRYYSHFPEIKDKKFHKLRKAYVKAAQELSDYCRLEEDLIEERNEMDDGEAESGNICDNCGKDAGNEFHICT